MNGRDGRARESVTPEASDAALAAGQDAARDLAAALEAAGFRLPSLRGDFPVYGSGHVQLGGASAALVSRLAAWIRERA